MGILPFSSLYFGMKTATGVFRLERDGGGITFSSLYFGMKTATLVNFKKAVKRQHFQFPILWDEDCNGGSGYVEILYYVSFSSLYFGMKTATC